MVLYNIIGWCNLASSVVFSLNEFREKDRASKTGYEYEKIDRPFVKSIESPDGDIIDCVLYNLQPAFDLPELKEYMTMVDGPIYICCQTSFNKRNVFGHLGLCKTGNEELKCGVIKRIGKEYVGFGRPYIWLLTMEPPIPEPPKGYDDDNEDKPPKIEQLWNSMGESCPNGTVPIKRPSANDDILRSISDFKVGIVVNATRARASATGFVHMGPYYGAKAHLNLCQPIVARNDTSLSQIWVTSTDTIGFENSVEAGWQDRNNGHWWLKEGDETVGFWPSKLFNTLRGRAYEIEYGGEVFYEKSDTHPLTQMRSGHFPVEGFKKAAFARNLEVVNENDVLKEVENLNVYASEPSCYGVKSGYSDTWKSYIYYGGPGYNPECQK
ncbi:protein neprosin-like [Bidens hawaiensis]|uniref:protein neprosin-like n=1 Tax=Bidens hawaiensis TaxID=980011 RepID=UPI00404AF612